MLSCFHLSAYNKAILKSLKHNRQPRKINKSSVFTSKIANRLKIRGMLAWSFVSMFVWLSSTKHQHLKVVNNVWLVLRCINLPTEVLRGLRNELYHRSVHNWTRLIWAVNYKFCVCLYIDKCTLLDVRVQVPLSIEV